MQKLWDKIKGWKVYFLSVGAIITSIGAWLGGTITTEVMVQSVWAAVTAMALRHGVTTDVTKGTGNPV